MSHTATVILGGFILLAAIYHLARWRGVSLRRALAVFAMLWAAASVVNLWLGVAHAGYSVAEELPILIIIFTIPTAVAWLLARRFG